MLNWQPYKILKQCSTIYDAGCESQRIKTWPTNILFNTVRWNMIFMTGLKMVPWDIGDTKKRLSKRTVFYSQCVRDSIKNVTWHFDDSQVLGVDPNARENCCLPCRSKSLSLCLSLSPSLSIALGLNELHPAFITQRFIMPKEQTHNWYTSTRKT